MRNILRLIEGKKSKIKGMWMYKKYIREQSIKNSIKLFNLNLILKRGSGVESYQNNFFAIVTLGGGTTLYVKIHLPLFFHYHT